jgi:hypothetical protein
MREWLECWLYGETLSLVGMKVAELVVVGRLLDALLVEATLVLSMVDRWLCLVLFTLVELENGVGCSGQLESNLLVEILYQVSRHQSILPLSNHYHLMLNQVNNQLPVPTYKMTTIHRMNDWSQIIATNSLRNHCPDDWSYNQNLV